MPELAEVEFFRKRWHQALAGRRVTEVLVHSGARVFRRTNTDGLRQALTGSRYLGSEAAAKQMLFRFSGGGWLGIHLGMSGELRAAPADYAPTRHDHLVLRTEKTTLILTDPRMFGQVLFHVGPKAPDWWTAIAPSILSPAFTARAVTEFLARRSRAPIKSVLLMQEMFPGIGNWMADEILWRAAINPARKAGALRPAEVRRLWRECRQVCRMALATIAGRGGSLPPDLNVRIPDTWLFNHRWRHGGLCPITRQPLARKTIGGRTTCWSPARQK
jgi:formamidopyrimidine-DNA glycosylase